MSLERRLHKLEKRAETIAMLPPHLAHLANTPLSEWTDGDLEAYVEDLKRRDPEGYADLERRLDEQEAGREA